MYSEMVISPKGKPNLSALLSLDKLASRISQLSQGAFPLSGLPGVSQMSIIRVEKTS